MQLSTKYEKITVIDIMFILLFICGTPKPGGIRTSYILMFCHFILPGLLRPTSLKFDVYSRLITRKGYLLPLL